MSSIHGRIGMHAVGRANGIGNLISAVILVSHDVHIIAGVADAAAEPQLHTRRYVAWRLL